MDIGRDLPLILGLVASVLAAIFLAAAETAILRISPIRAITLSEQDRRGRRLRSLIDRLPAVLSAILLGALLTQIAAATLTGILAQRWFGTLGVTIASVVLTLFLFVYGEAIPKTFAVRHTDAVALVLATPIAVLELLLRPIVGVLVWFADIQMPGKGVTTSPTVTEDELRRLATRAAREGEITAEDLDLIEKAFRFGDRRADDVMVPRTDIVAVNQDASVEDALGVALHSGHRRLPVYEETVEEISGLVTLKDLVRAEDDAGGLPVRVLMTKPLVVPESKRIFDLLVEMQREHTHLAIVVDEYGGTAGLVTIEDIAEELLGSISESDVGEAEAMTQTAGGWSIDGSVPVEDLEEMLDVELPEGDWNTAAGLVMGLLGKVPAVGDQVEVDRYRMRVTQVRGRRVTRIEVRSEP